MKQTFEKLYNRACEIRLDIPEDYDEMSEKEKYEKFFDLNSLVGDFIEAFEHETLMELCDFKQ